MTIWEERRGRYTACVFWRLKYVYWYRDIMSEVIFWYYDDMMRTRLFREKQNVTERTLLRYYYHYSYQYSVLIGIWYWWWYCAWVEFIDLPSILCILEYDWYILHYDDDDVRLRYRWWYRDTVMWYHYSLMICYSACNYSIFYDVFCCCYIRTIHCDMGRDCGRDTVVLYSVVYLSTERRNAAMGRWWYHLIRKGLTEFCLYSEMRGVLERIRWSGLIQVLWWVTWWSTVCSMMTCGKVFYTVMEKVECRLSCWLRGIEDRISTSALSLPHCSMYSPACWVYDDTTTNYTSAEDLPVQRERTSSIEVLCSMSSDAQWHYYTLCEACIYYHYGNSIISFDYYSTNTTLLLLNIILFFSLTTEEVEGLLIFCWNLIHYWPLIEIQKTVTELQ